MPTKRTPITRKHQPPLHITPKSIELFDAFVAAVRQCVGPDPGECLDNSCPGCKEAWRLRHMLHDELGLNPLSVITIERPEHTCPWSGTAGAEEWPKAQARWRALEAASQEAKKVAHNGG